MADQKISIVIAARNMVASGFRGVVGAAKNLRAQVVASLAGVANVAKRVAASIGIIGAAAIAVTKKLVDAYQVQAQAEAKLSATLRATGYAAGFTSNELKKYAAELQKTVGIGDEVTISMMGILASFKNIRGDTFKQATAAIIDMAANLGKAGKGSADVEAAVIQVGKALNDPIRGMAALGRVGIVFTGQQRKQITALQESGDLLSAQAIILRELQNEFGGVAKSMYEADSGLKRLSNSWGDFQEALGNALVENIKIKGSLDGVSRTLEDLVNDGYIELFAQDTASAIKKALTWVDKYVSAVSFMKRQMENMTGITALRSIKDALTGGGGAPDKTLEDRLAEIQRRRKEIEAEADEQERYGMIWGKIDNDRADAQARLAALIEQRRKQIKEYAKDTKKIETENKKAEEEEKKRDEETAESKKKLWEKIEAIYDARIEKAEKLADKEKELAKELAAEEKRLARQTANEKKRLLDEQLAKAKEVAEKTISGFIEERRAAKKAKEDDAAEFRNAAKLADKEKRGIRLSKRDKEFLDVAREIARARGQIPGLEREAARAQAQIDALAENTKSLGEIKKLLADNLKEQQALSKLG